MKILCYGVRDVEKKFFDAVNKKFNYQLTCTAEYLNSSEQAKLAKDHDAVILRGNCWATKEVLDIYKKLGVKYVVTRTVGVNHIDVQYAQEIGLKTAFVPFYSPNAIAELAVTFAMMLLRNTAYTVEKTRKKDFTVDVQMFSREIRNCTVGILGMGRIGLVTASLFKGLGANVLGYDIIKSEAGKEILTQVDSVDELLHKSDIVSLHVPYIKNQGKVITHDFIAKMKPDSILINTSRGENQDIDAIIKGVESGHLAGVGLDVLENESDIFFQDFTGQTLPIPQVEKLVALYPKVLLSPHIGSYTDEAVVNMIETTLENLQELKTTGTTKNFIKV